MGSDQGRHGSILIAYHAVYDGLLAIKSKSQELLGASMVDEAHRDALTFVKTATSLLMKILPDIKRSIDLHVIAPQIHHIARSLELRLSRLEEMELAIKDVGMLHYPRLTSHTARFGDVLGSVDGCKWLQKDMTTAYDALEPLLSEDNIDDDAANSALFSVPYDDLFHSSADRLFRAMSSCEGSLEVRLRLGAFRSVSPVHNDRALDILLQCKDETEQFWLTINVHSPPGDTECDIFPDGGPKLQVTFADTEKQKLSWKIDDPSKVECICSHAEGMSPIFKTYLQHLELDKNDVWQVHECLMIPSDYATEEYNFPDLFSQMNWTDVDKIVLAMQLSYALSYHYDGSWLSGRWQQANIRFFQRGPQIPCKPWLRVSLPNQSPQVAPKSLFHRIPQLLELGTILLELQIGQSLESFLGMKPAKTLDEQWGFATTIFFTKLNHGLFILSRHYRRAIEFCLKPDKSLKQADSIRKSIYENVVRPLEQAIAESKLDDEAFEALDLGSLKRAAVSSPSLPEPEKRAERVEQAPPPVAAENVEITVPIPQPEEEFAAGEIDEGFNLFGDEDGLQSDKDRSKDSNDWLTSFKKIIEARIGKKSKLVSDRRVKVALLDTGIDLKHSYFDRQYPNGQIKSICSWVGGKGGAEDKDGGDASGHGTFIASILLSYGPNIDLYVARVAESRKFKKGTSMNVANALYHAQEEWDVDIITMSFGYPLGHRDIWNQITKATQNNILVFAAASNDGRNQSRMFPARQLSVFAIHSTNGKGIKSDFNPPPAKDENFSILGEYIESAWLTSLTEGSGITRCLSGTSFATPIAVCLSSFLLTYVPILIPEHERLFHKIKNYEGMRNMLQAIVAVDEAEAGSRYQYLGVEKFFKENTTIAVGETIKKALSL